VGNEHAIKAAIRAYTDWVREHMGFPVHNCKPSPTPPDPNEGLDEWKRKVLGICEKMDELTANPESRFADFERLRFQLGSNFPTTPFGYLQSVADAFRDARRLGPK
jgi:hypothetical protein